MKALARLRMFFIIYFVIKVIAEISMVLFNEEALNMSSYGITDFNVSTGTMVIVVLLLNVLLFLIGLWLFQHLLELKNWSRIILVIIGFLAVLDFLTSLLFSSTSVKMLREVNYAVDWNNLIIADLVIDFIGVIFWGYLIYLLLFNNNIKQLFRAGNLTDQNL